MAVMAIRHVFIVQMGPARGKISWPFGEESREWGGMEDAAAERQSLGIISYAF